MSLRTVHPDTNIKKGNLTFRSIAGIILMFVLIIGTGFWISHGGKPYNTGLFTLHKLLSLGAVALMAVITVKAHRTYGLTADSVVGVIATGVLFLGTMVTGGILSVDITPLPVILQMHHILPFCFEGL